MGDHRLNAKETFYLNVYRLQRMDAKGSRARVAFALLSALAICCSVMYITADGDAETVLAARGFSPRANKFIGSGYDIRRPRSIESVDVKKAGMIVTNTPDGRMRLLKYLNKVEKQIAKESAGRRADIAAIRAHMARNFAYNQAARATMKKQLLAKMAVNARYAKRSLDRNMRRVQAKFAAQAELSNKRNSATIRRSRRTRKIMAANKRAAAASLKIAVLNQQRALAALASATNAKIKQTNSHIAANAAQIKENAKKARKDLEKPMARFDHKMANVSEQAKKGRSKLAAQAAAQDKAFRNFANNKIRAIAASTAAQFRKVRARMAKDRHHADMMLKAASSRMDAALSAKKALQDKRFSKTVSKIAEAKREAAARVNAARSEFKVGLMKLGATARRQTAKLNSRVTTLQNTVTRNKLEQAKVNRNVHAELMRMVKLGNKRYNEHIKKDKELRSLMAKNKAETLRRMKRMADSFNMNMSKIRHQMAKDRRHSSNNLRRATNKLYATLARNQRMQDLANRKQVAATRRGRMQAMSALRRSKASFARRLARMHAVAVRSARKQQHKINKLAGVVNANAVKSAKGRAMLKAMSQTNRNDIHGAISAAIKKGEQRALAIMKKAKGREAKNRATLNGKVSTMISSLRKSTSRSIYALSMENKAARKQLKKEVLYAVRAAAKRAKSNLKKSVQWANGRFAALNTVLARNNRKSAAARSRLNRQINAEQRRASYAIRNAVAKQNRALLALKTETAKRLKKSNSRLSSHAAQMARNARAVAAQMKSDVATLEARVSAARRSAQSHLAAADRASVRRYSAALSQIGGALKKAKAESDNRFGKLYSRMAKQRKQLDTKLASSVRFLNDKLAEHAALQDVRFSHTVKKIKQVRFQATQAVRFAKKQMAVKLTSLTSSIKASESRIKGEISVVSGAIASDRANQIRVNRRVNKELGRIVHTANVRHSQSKRARGKLRAILTANKRAAAAETAALAKKTRFHLSMLRAQQARLRRNAAKDLSSATRRLRRKMKQDARAQNAIVAGQRAALRGAAAAAKSALKAAKSEFSSKLNTMVKRVSGIAHAWKKNTARTRNLMKENTRTMNRDLTRALARSVEIGQKKMERSEARMRKNVNKMVSQVRTCANEKIEDNSLPLKAYAATAADKINDYVAKGKGRGLGSIGDLLKTVGSRVNVKVGKDEGIGAGATKIPMIFSAKKITVQNPVTKINWLVDEYIKLLSEVKQRWPIGFGKYLLSKVESNMQKRGILEVDRVAGKAGNFVFINAHSVGLSSKLSDFEGLAVRMTRYQTTLAKMTGKLSQKHKKMRKKVFVKPPEWEGN